MDSHGQDIVEDILRVLGKDREKTRNMKVSLGADLAALVAMEIEREMLRRKKDQMLAVKEADEKLVADFLEADGKKNFDAQKIMLGAIEAAMNRGAGGDYGGKINTQKSE